MPTGLSPRVSPRTRFLDTTQEHQPVGPSEDEPRPRPIVRVSHQNGRIRLCHFHARAVPPASAASAPDEWRVSVRLSSHEANPSFAGRFEIPAIWRRGIGNTKSTKRDLPPTLRASFAIECKWPGPVGLYVPAIEICPDLGIDEQLCTSWCVSGLVVGVRQRS